MSCWSAGISKAKVLLILVWWEGGKSRRRSWWCMDSWDTQTANRTTSTQLSEIGYNKQEEKCLPSRKGRRKSATKVSTRQSTAQASFTRCNANITKPRRRRVLSCKTATSGPNRWCRAHGDEWLTLNMKCIVRHSSWRTNVIQVNQGSCRCQTWSTELPVSRLFQFP